MIFNFSDPHVIHVLAAYAVAGILLAGLAFFTWRDWQRARRDRR